MSLKKLKSVLCDHDILTPGEVVSLAYSEAIYRSGGQSDPVGFLRQNLTDGEIHHLSRFASLVNSSLAPDTEGYCISYVTPQAPVEVQDSSDAMIPISFVRAFVECAT